MIVNAHDLVPFLCQATGRCCIHNLVILSSFDIFRIARALEISAKELFEKKILTYRINPSSFWMEAILNSRSNSTCPFLTRSTENVQEQYLCDIYEERPLVCRIYPLKFDKEEKLFLRFLPAENRCYECISSEKNITLNEYLDNSKVPELLEEFKSYLSLVDRIIEKGFNLDKIKKNKLAQKKFFAIQSLLYETYPMKDSSVEELPFSEIELEVNKIMLE